MIAGSLQAQKLGHLPNHHASQTEANSLSQGHPLLTRELLKKSEKHIAIHIFGLA